MCGVLRSIGGSDCRSRRDPGMIDIYEFIAALEQIKSMFKHGELTQADIDHFIRKYESQVERFEEEMFDNLPV
jgi:hypothetical protein